MTVMVSAPPRAFTVRSNVLSAVAVVAAPSTVMNPPASAMTIVSSVLSPVTVMLGGCHGHRGGARRRREGGERGRGRGRGEEALLGHDGADAGCPPFIPPAGGYRGGFACALADPVHNVELRRNHHGQESVVFAFPYRADIVDAVRSIPGRRFDWEAKEWWAPRADATAAVRARACSSASRSSTVAPEVEAWLARAVKGWVGRVTAGKRSRRRAVRARRDLRRAAGGAGRRSPSGAAAAPGCRSRRRSPRSCSRCRARGWTRARCAAPRGCRSARSPRRRRSRWSRAYGEPRFTLDVNWDPETIPAFLALPAVRGARPLAAGRPVPARAARALPAHATASTSAANAREVLDAAARRARRGDRRRPPLASHSTPRAGVEDRLGGELRPFQRAGVRLRARGAARCSSPTSRASARPCEALAALEADDAYPAVVVCPASLKLNWQREIEHWLPHRSVHVVSGTGRRSPKRRHHGPQLRDRPRPPRAARAARGRKALVLDESHYVKNPRAKRTQAVRRLAEALPEDALRLALTGTPVMNHPDELIAQLRMIGRLEDFGSRRALHAPLPGRGRRGADPLAPAPRAASCGG